jgi:hypothetical protein
VKRKKKDNTVNGTLDLNSVEAVRRFQKAAEDFTREATRSKEAALKVLVEAGIYTKSGKLTKNYHP